jgi:hypothetical protein
MSKIQPADLEPLSRITENIDRDGWATTGPVFHAHQVARLLDALEPALVAAGNRGGVRDLLATQEKVREFASAWPMREAAVAVLGPSCGAVRAILFDKTPAANWKVIWPNRSPEHTTCC